VTGAAGPGSGSESGRPGTVVTATAWGRRRRPADPGPKLVSNLYPWHPARGRGPGGYWPDAVQVAGPAVTVTDRSPGGPGSLSQNFQNDEDSCLLAVETACWALLSFISHLLFDPYYEDLVLWIEFLPWSWHELRKPVISYSLVAQAHTVRITGTRRWWSIDYNFNHRESLKIHDLILRRYKNCSFGFEFRSSFDPTATAISRVSSCFSLHLLPTSASMFL